MTNSRIRQYASHFHKLIESGEFLILPFNTIVFNTKLYIIFTDKRYYFSLTGYDMFPVDSHENEEEVYQLCREMYTAKNEAKVIALQVDFYYRHRSRLKYLSSNSFECMKSESFVGNWICERIKVLDGHKLTAQYEEAMYSLEDYIRQNPATHGVPK